MNQLATQQTNDVQVADQESETLLSIIKGAASNPQVDIDKMERLLAMHERIVARDAKAQYFSALAEMQTELPVISERGKIKNNSGGVQSTYALWEDVNEAIRPVLTRFGFALSFRCGNEGDNIKVTGVLSHRGGHYEETTMLLPADKSGSKNVVQSVGSSTSYGKRYTACALLNLTSKGEDDDGQKGAVKFITENQAADLQCLAEEVKADVPLFLKYLSKVGKVSIGSIAEIPAVLYQDAVGALERKRTKK